MIVDMIRNDMGRVAEVGSVHVPVLFEVERYPTVLQMTSTVTSRTNVSVADVFKALFPCASITGAPKVSAMGIIADLEPAAGESTPARLATWRRVVALSSMWPFARSSWTGRPPGDLRRGQWGGVGFRRR